MNPDAGTEEFFWREMTIDEERETKRLLAEAEKQKFLDEIKRIFKR